MQQRQPTYTITFHTEEARRSSSDFVSPLREMYQLRRNVMKLEKQRTDESCHRKSEELIKNISQSHREIIPQQLKFDEQQDGRGTAKSTNSVAHNYEVIKPNQFNIDWNNENKENQSIKNNNYQHLKHNNKVKNNHIELQRQQINKTISQLNKNNKQLGNVLKQQIDRLFETIKNDYTYTGV